MFPKAASAAAPSRLFVFSQEKNKKKPLLLPTTAITVITVIHRLYCALMGGGSHCQSALATAPQMLTSMLDRCSALIAIPCPRVDRFSIHSMEHEQGYSMEACLTCAT